MNKIVNDCHWQYLEDPHNQLTIQQVMASDVVNIVDDPVDYVRVKSINDVANALGMKTVAEFVENDAIVEKLKEIGPGYLQGYGIAKPEKLC